MTINLVGCYWLWLYIPLILIAFYYFFAKKFLKYGILFTFAGLVRPEGWFLGLIFLISALYKRFPKKSPLLIPFLAPILWLIFDARAFQNPFYSFTITTRYPKITGIPATTFFQFSPTIVKDLSDLTGLQFLLASVMGIFFTLFRSQKKLSSKQTKGKNNYFFLLLITLFPFIFYLLLSLRGEVLLIRRFFLSSLNLLAFYIFNLPNLFFMEILLRIIFTLLIVILFLTLNFPLGRVRENYKLVKNLEIKIKAIEGSLFRIENISDSLKDENRPLRWAHCSISAEIGI